MLALAIAMAGCTKPNPAFDPDGGETRGEDETGKDTKDSTMTSFDVSTDLAASRAPASRPARAAD